MKWHTRKAGETVTWLLLFFPQPLSHRRALGLLRQWAATPTAPQVILEARATASGIEYLVGVPESHAARIARDVEQLIPGAVVVPYPSSDRHSLATARRLVLTSRQRPLEPTDQEASTRSVLSALTSVRPGEQVALQVVLGPRHQPATLPPQLPRDGQTVASRLWGGIAHDTRPDTRQAAARKLGGYGFTARVRAGVQAATPARRRELLLGVVSALRTVHAPGVGLRVVQEKATAVNAPAATWSLSLRTSRLSVPEVGHLSAWPISENDEPLPGQPPAHPKPTRPTPTLATGERIVGTATAPGTATPVGYNVIDRLRHTWVLGPNGTGKSTLLLNLLVQDLGAGQPIVVIEPKDLIRDLLACVPAAWHDKVAVLDPLDDAPIGINPLAPTAGDRRTPEQRADAMFAMFEALYGDALGVRSSDILRHSLVAVALHDTPSLALVPLLLADERFRRPLVARAVARDPIAAGSFWAWFDQLSPETAANVTAPLANKLRPVLMPTLRRVVAQQAPRFNMRDVLAGKAALLVPLQKGVIGASAAELLAAIVLAELWQAIRERAGTPEHARRPVSVVIDEVQDYLRLPTDLADALATARSLGAGFTLANQFSGQLPRHIAEAVRANARSRVCFALAPDDARLMAAGQSVLVPDDFTLLPAYHAYAQLVRDNHVQPWTSIQTRPAPEPTSDPELVRAASRQHFGRAAEDIDAEFHALFERPTPSDGDPQYGRKARPS